MIYFVNRLHISIFVEFKKIVEMKYWLVTTDHLEDDLWFRDDDDFRRGMNGVAVLAANEPVFVLAFILMSNHVHFVLAGERKDVESFINKFKCAHSRYLQKKYGVKEPLRGNKVHIEELESGGEAREKAIAYTQMNCVAANICAFPSAYPWGSGACFFNATSPRGVLVKNLSKSKRIHLLRSKIAIPETWRIDNGYVTPDSYVAVKAVESIYGTPKRMNYFLQNSSKAKLRIESGESSLPSFRDQLVAAAIPEICRALFKKNSFDCLTDSEKGESLRQIRFRFGSNVHQMARTTRQTYNEVARRLDTY